MSQLNKKRIMKITKVDLYQVEIPLIPVVKYFPKIYDIIPCRIQTNEGKEEG